MGASEAAPRLLCDEVYTCTAVAGESQSDLSSDGMLWTLDRRDTWVLKGMAISAIVFHNFFHAVSPVQQNEFTFDPRRFLIFLRTVQQPALAIQACFSFFGHFGVQIFIFLSAYGLAKTRWDVAESWGTFMAGRVKKLYPVFGLVVAPWFLASCLRLGTLTMMKSVGLQVALMFVGLSTFLPGHGLPPIGPWWFIAFIVQFYAMWPLLRRLTLKFGWPGLLVLSVVCMAATFLVTPLLDPRHINLLETPLGRMANICFGIAAARYPIRIRGGHAAAAGVVFVVGNLYAPLWPLTFVAALIGMLWGYQKVRGMVKGSGVLERIGRYSLVIFLVNGIVRNEFVPMASSPQLQLVYGCLSAVATFAITVILQSFVRRWDKGTAAG